MMVGGILAGMLYNRAGGRLPQHCCRDFDCCRVFPDDTYPVGYDPGFVVVCLLLIGFGLGLMLTPASNMIMNSVSKKYQGMVQASPVSNGLRR